MPIVKKLNAIFFGFFIFLCLTVNQTQAADTTLSGTISLPPSVSAYATNHNMTVRINHGWNGSWFTTTDNCQSVQLIAETTSAIFDCTIPDLSGPIVVYVDAWGFEGIYYNNYYHSNGTGWTTSEAEQLASGNNHPNIDITLLPGIILEGELRTPDSMTFATDRSFSIYWRYYEDGWWEWGSGVGSTLTASSTSTAYSLIIPAHIGDIKVGYEWQNTPETSYVDAGYYHAIKVAEYNLDDASFLSTLAGDVNEINITLLQGIPVTGIVSLPSGETNSDGMQVRIAARPVGEWSDLGSVDLDMPAGTTFANYTLYVPPGDNIEVRYTNITGADRSYMAEGHYAGSSTSFKSSDAVDFSAASPPASVDLTLIAGNTISGQVSVPSGVATYTINGNIQVSFRTPWDLWETSLWGYFYISINDSSAEYNVVVPENASNISVRYSATTVDFLQSGYYSAEGTTWDYSQQTRLPGGNDYPNIDLTFLLGVLLSGNVGLPDYLDATSPIDLNFAAYIYDPLANRWTSIGYDYSTINSGSNSTSYNISVPADIGDIVLGYSSWGDTGYISNGYFNTTATTSNVDLATPVSTATDQPDLDMTLVKYNSITGQIFLTGGESAPKNIYIRLGALTQPDGDYHTTNSGLWSYHTTQKLCSYVFIPEGSNSVDYTLNTAEDIGNTSIEYSISTSDVDYVKHGFYAIDRGDNVTVFFADADLFAANSNHPNTDMTMPHGVLVQGTVTLSEPARKSELVEIGLRPVATGIDNFYDTTLFIPWQTTSIDYSYRALFDSNAVVGMKTGGKNGYLPELYFKTSTETASELADATVLASGTTIPTNVAFNLYSWVGDVNLDTHINLTDTILSLQTASGFTGLSVFKEGDATGDSRIGVEDAVYVLQDVAGMFNPVPCALESDCGENQFCQRTTCTDSTGTCTDIPSSGDCSWSATTVCGCDGETYMNACEAAIADTNVDSSGNRCAPQ